LAWIQISFLIDRDQVPLIEAAMISAGAMAVTLGDAGDEPQLEPPPGATPLWTQVRLTALFPDDPEAHPKLRELSLSLAARSGTEPHLERMEDQVWERVWMDDLAPLRFGERLWVAPRGQSVPAPGSVVVELDPGLAFGTGHHPTTALCLRWLDSADLQGKSIIDYGCGSGILAIAALRLGAASVVAVDHDPQALEATRANAEQNAVAGRLLACLPEQMPDEPSDLLVANILAGPLVELAPRLAELTRPGGYIALSGILSDQTAQIQDAYEPWLELSEPQTEDDWVLLSGRRRTQP
jgi:ribosomal protein L11 methyltransferase